MKVYLALDSFRCLYPINFQSTTVSLRIFFFGQELVPGVASVWLLTLVIIVNGGESPARFETREYSSYKQCMSAAKVSERKVGVIGYCDRIKE